MTPPSALVSAVVDRSAPGTVDAAWLAELRGLGGGAVDLDRVLPALVDEVARRFGADRGTLYVIDAARGEVVSRAANLPELPTIRLRPGEGVAGWVAQTGEAVRAGRGDARFTERIDALTGYRTRTLLAAPVRWEGAVVGVLQLLNHASGGFGPGHERRLGEIARQVGALLGPARSGARARGVAPAEDEVVGASPALERALARLDRAASTEATVLLRGESGTGKELAARRVHAGSRRAAGPLVVVDCASLPEALIENELFGHERGAFTGAERAQEGRVAAAAGGTLFLDEIGELPLSVQGRLLRLVQDRTFYRVGGARPERADVRFVAATWRDLEAEVRAGRFRADLYWRLRVVEVRLPSLSERGPDELDLLIDTFLDRFGARYDRPVSLSTEARRALHAHTWPGNVRELQHCLEAAVALSEGPVVGPDLLFGFPVPEAPSPGASAPAASVFGATLAEMEERWIAETLRACAGNRTEAARKLGIGRNTLARKLRAAGAG